MRNRLFLLALVAVLLLVQSALRAAAQATPFSGGSTWGGISFWEIRGALPMGVFAAAILLVCTAGMAQLTLAALRMTGRSGRLGRNASALTSACLWCGAPLLLACYPSLSFVFSWVQGTSLSAWQTETYLQWAIHGSLILLILCRFINFSNRAWVAWVQLPAALLVLLILGLICFNSAMILFPCAAMSTAGFLMLYGRGKRWAAIPLLTAMAMIFTLVWFSATHYAASFPALIIYLLTTALLAVLLHLKLSALRG